MHYPVERTDEEAIEVTAASKTCGRCGAAISPNTPHQSCGACLLETALGPLGEERDEPINRASGPVVMDFGDYELLEEIGRGGQGVVFRARQKSLNRIVALKVIALGPWATETHIKRFRLEAEAAASLDHPRIVPIYEIGEREGSCYFSMKYVDGGQLDALVRREPLPLRTAVELVVNLARTVHYAHQRGILHRDIKPGNVLLDKNGEPNLTDFGLARLVESESNITRTMEVLGTPSYIAPEQAVGQTNQLTAATDVYGLGAVFYHLVTGHPPFAGGTTYETIRMVLETEPRQPRLWNPKLDRDLATICLKCLEKDSTRRYPSTLALGEDLERWLRHEPIQARPTGVISRTGKWIRRNPALTAVTILVMGLSSALGFMLWKSISEQPPQSGIAVLPFENLGDDQTNTFLADGMQDDILTKLAKVAELKVISRTSVMQYRGERNLRKIGNALRVSHILEGSVRKADNKIRLNAQLIDTRTDAHVWAEHYEGDMSEVFAIQNSVAEKVVAQLNPRISLAERSAMKTKPTQDIEAYDLYLRAKQLIYWTSIMDPDPIATISTAIPILEKTVTRDPGFALAYCALAEANLLLYWQPGKPAEPRAKAEAALKVAMQLAPDAGETHLVHALFLYWANLDYGNALEELEIAARLLPNSAEVFQKSSWVERRLGRWREALRHGAKAAELDPRNPVMREDLIRDYIMTRRYSEAVRFADKAIADFPENPEHFQIQKTQALFNQGDLKKARLAIESCSPSSPMTVPKFLCWFEILLGERNYLEAEQFVSKRTEFLNHQELIPDVCFDGFVAHARNDAEKTRSAFLACREGLQEQLRDRPSMGIWLSNLALADAALGRREDALRESARAMEISDALDRSEFALDRANIYCWLGEHDRALEELSKIAKGGVGVIYGDLRFDPAWDPLRDDPRFSQILADSATPIPLL